MLDTALICITVLLCVYLCTKQVTLYLNQRGLYIDAVNRLRSSITKDQATIKAQLRKTLENQEEALKLRDDLTKLMISRGFGNSK